MTPPSSRCRVHARRKPWLDGNPARRPCDRRWWGAVLWDCDARELRCAALPLSPAELPPVCRPKA